MTAIDCDGVSFVYGDRRALTDVSLRVEAGTIFCLLGPNGAGKTTLVRQVTGSLRPRAGRVRVLGMDPAVDRERARRQLGIIPQDVGLFESLTAWQHLWHIAALKGVRRRERRAANSSTAARCALEPLLGRRVSGLSLGERRRLLVALALLAEPPVLVMDEPTLGLDPVVRRGFWALLERQRALGRTVFLTTHYLDEAQHLADQVAILDGGRLVRSGSLSEFLAGQSTLDDVYLGLFGSVANAV
jgi:ABC-2 type transport system ATP-binding protein